MDIATEQKLLLRCKRCEHQWEDIERYPVRCPKCGSIQWRYVRDKKVLADFKQRAMVMDNGKIVCPICGLVWEDGKVIATTDSIAVWVERHFGPKACPDCVANGKTVGYGGVFEFSEVTK